MDTADSLSLAGLNPHQIRRLTEYRDDMLGWELAGYTVDMHGDYYTSAEGRTPDIAEAEIVSREKAEEMAQFERDNDEPGDEREYTVVAVYRKGDLYEAVPAEAT